MEKSSLITLEHLTADPNLRKFEHEEFKKAHAVVVRHGYSESNAGLRSDALGTSPLTEQGHKQAKHLAEFLPCNPTVIIHSPFIRTRQTANPSIARFPDADILEWPIQEFTYLNPEKFNGTTNAERKEYSKNYWQELNPEYRNGGLAESFVDLWKRVELFRENLNQLLPGALIFTHGQFMKMMRLQENFDQPNRDAMAGFKVLDETLKIANTSRVTIQKNGKISLPKISHLPANLITY